MPISSKRTLEEIANKSASSDGDYDDHPTRSRKKPKSKQKASRPSRRRSRVKRDSDESEDSLLDAESFQDSASDPEDGPLEMSATGRPMRGTVKSAQERPKYRDSSSEDGSDDEDLEQDDEEEKSGNGAKGKKGKKELVVKLRFPKSSREVSSDPPGRPMRGSRARSGSAKPPELAGWGNRRSTRRTNDDSEDIIALSGSGRHVETVRRGTHSPEARPRRSATGLRAGVTIAEEQEEEESKKNDVEVMESDPHAEPEAEADATAVAQSDPSNNDEAEVSEVEMAENDFVPESQHDEVEQEQEEDEDEDEDEEDAPRSGTRARSGRKGVKTAPETTREASTPRRSSRRIAEKPRRRRQDEGSDFEPNEEEANEDDDDDVSDSAGSKQSPRKPSRNNSDDPESGSDRRSRLRKRQSQSRAESDAGDLVDELAELKPSRARRRERPPIVYEEKPRRSRKSVDYRIIRPELALPIEEAENEHAASPSRRGRTAGGGSWQRGLFSTSGPFGGAGGPPPLLGGGPTGMGATGGVESDSSDDEGGQNQPKAGGPPGMAGGSSVQNLGLPGQTHGADAAQGASGAPANLGKVKDKQALADSDPLGVDPSVNFDGVGGMQGHIDQLKEMVSLPLLYPEIFQRFHIVPPRGVLFHGPPGTGKTLLARALASSVSSQGRKVTFYMRKGADALSKWVGEAERQLRLLFEEARKNQPSIIFFDEIDGLAPVRSSKQEQIHASIVSTLLALMDGMDGRGQVIVIGATNRPDSIDPALRRPGRFDREFYFPLPNTEARRSILDIHTKRWDPPLPGEIKDELAELTKGYGGADLRALCTEAALNAVQRKYPQIYRANEKLLIDPKKIDVGAKDFMMSIKKMVPSSERSSSSGATPLPETVEPLLRDSLRAIKEVISELVPIKKSLTALEEAEFEEPDGAVGFRRERMQQAFETSRVFRPRMLIHGKSGMGQGYVASALLNHFEGLHVQSFDLSTLLSDSTRSPEATVVQLFTEVKRHKPSVIYIPDVDTWYATVGQTVISTFLGMLRSLSPTDPVLLLGVAETESDVQPEMVTTLFGYSKKNSYGLKPPQNPRRHEFFRPFVNYIKTPPSDFPDPANRKRRKLEVLEPAPAPPPSEQAPPNKEALKAQKKKDRQTLNLLKVRIQPIMDQIKKYKRFRTGVIDDTQIRYLFDDDDPNILTTDLPLEQRTAFRPFEKDIDKNGVPGLREVASGKFFFNMDIVTIEKRLSNGYYKKPKDFLGDIKRIAKDAQQLGDQDRLIKANELLSNVEVDIGVIEQSDPNLIAECEHVYARELERERLAIEKAERNAAAGGAMGPPPTMNVAHGTVTESGQSTAPIVLGEAILGAQTSAPARPVTPSNNPNAQDPVPNGNVDQFGADPHQTHQPGGQTSTSNGSNLTHKTSTDHDGDVQMSNSGHGSGAEHGGTQNSSFGPSAQPKPPNSYTAPSQQLRQESGMSNFSQKDTVTPMAPGSQPGDYVNEASTTQTTSDKKHSGPNSGPSDHSHNQSLAYIRLSGQHDGPDLNNPDRVSGDENLPDTQGNSSWASSQQIPLTGIMDYAHSQASGVNGSQAAPRQSQHQRSHPPVPHFDGSPRLGTAGRGQHRVHDMLNADEGAADDPTLTLDEEYVKKLHDELTSRTSGCSVEQLEQINTNLMDCVWKARGEWDRTKVVDNVKETFNDVLADMQMLQDFDPMSQKNKDDFTRSTV